MEAGLAGFADDFLDAVDQQRSRRAVVAADVVEADVAEAAFLPVAAVGDGQLVPAPVRPQPVHGVEHVEQRQVAVERQAVPGRGADFGEGDVRFAGVEVANLAVNAGEGADQVEARAFAFQIFQQRENRALAVVERDVVEIIEDARLFQLAQFGIDVAAAEHGDDVRVHGLDRLRHAEGGIDRAGEGHGEQHDVWTVAVNGRQGQFFEGASISVGGCGQGSGQRFEGRLAARQRFGVADEFETRIDRLAQHVGEIVQIQGGKVSGPVLHAERAKGPGQRITAVVVDVFVERGEARSFGQEIAPADAMADRRVAPLQEGDGRGDGGERSGRSVRRSSGGWASAFSPE